MEQLQNRCHNRDMSLGSVSQAARRLGVSAGTVRLWADRGVLPTIRVDNNRARVFHLRDLERLAEQQAGSR